MISQVDRVVAHADVSLNTELDVIDRAVRRRTPTGTEPRHRPDGRARRPPRGHPRPTTSRRSHARPSTCRTSCCAASGPTSRARAGSPPTIATCRSSRTWPNDSRPRSGRPSTSSRAGTPPASGGRSGPCDTGRINDLRLGEAILLGRDPLDRRPIDGLRTDAFRLVVEVIESKTKPRTPWGEIHQGAFGHVAAVVGSGEGSDGGSPDDNGSPDDTVHVIAAVGRQDVDPDGLDRAAGVDILGASSDHLVLRADEAVPVGSELSFGVEGYGALLRAMTSPFVERVFLPRR